MFHKIVDFLVGRPEPSDDRIGKVEKRVDNIETRLDILTAKAKVKERRHTSRWT